MTTLQLTDAGVDWIAMHLDSLVARVALMGYGCGWPDEFVTTAIQACNDAGERR